jgi:RNA polymerase sigma-70 factor (ECF subfamily)
MAQLDGDRRRLVERAASGDHEAFARLMAASIDRMHAVAGLILGDPDDARDATQEALVRAWRQLHRLRDPERFDAWLRRLLVNTCHDIGRRRRAHVRLSSPLVEVGPTTGGDWHRVEEADRLGRAIARLPLEQRTVLVLAHYLGLTAPEIAAAMGTPVGTVHSRTRYAVRALRAALDADDRIPELVTP